MIRQLSQHKSIRKYTNQPVGKELLDAVLEAGVRASNTGNMQLYSIVVTQDEEMKEKLSPSHFNQPMVKGAPVVITFCADFRRFHQWCELNNADASYDDFLWLMCGTIDSMLVAQNVCVAAESKGLGICYLGTTLYNAPRIIDTLSLPKGVVPITTVTMGWPDEAPALTDRLPMNSVVHYESYNDFTDEQIKEFYSHKESLEESIQFVKENNKENLAQVYTDVRYKRGDNEHFTKVLKETLIAQGFKL